MIEQHTSDVVRTSKKIAPGDGAGAGEHAELVVLINGNVILLSERVMRLYRSEQDVGDPLGNGLLYTAELPETAKLAQENGQFMSMHKAGVIGLMDEKILLVTPNDIQMFPDRPRALRNTEEILRIPLSES